MARLFRPKVLTIIFAALVLCWLLPSCGKKDKDTQPLSEVAIDLQNLNQTKQTYLLGLAADPKDKTAQAKYNYLVELSTEDKGNAMVLVDTLNLGNQMYTTVMECGKTPLLELEKSTLIIKENGQPNKETTVTVKQGKAYISTHDGHKRDIDYPAGTVSQSGLFRLATLLPKTPGKKYSFKNFSDPIDINVEVSLEGEPYFLECMGTETATINGKPVECTLFVLQRTNREMKFYVDPQNQMAMMETDGGATRMMLLTPDQAEKLRLQYEKAAAAKAEAAKAEAEQK